MAAKEHHGSSRGIDTAQTSLQDCEAVAWNLVDQQLPRSPAERIISTQVPSPTSLSVDPPLSPQSVDAPSFHTAFSQEVNEGVQVDEGGEEELGALGATSEEKRNHRRNESATPAPSLDTISAKKAQEQRGSETNRFPLSPLSAGGLAVTSASSPPKSHISPRTRDRGSLLRRSILSRGAHGPTQSSRSGIELQTANPSSSQSGSEQPSKSSGVSKKYAATITVSGVTDRNHDADEDSSSTKKAYVASSLPHYERWVATKITRPGLLAQIHDLKERIRKKILRIHEKPPSKDGRHLNMDFNRKKCLIDERTGQEYIDNTILSTRYSLYNFLPRQLFAQFSKLANFYFLCVSILQMIPGLSTTGTYTTIVPLLFFVTISMAKEGYDDLRRYRQDKAENNRLVSVLPTVDTKMARSPEGQASVLFSEGAKHWAETKWHGVRVGDVIKLHRDEAVPADIAVLQASGAEEVAYIETMALDGETNLKNKHAPPLLASKCKTTDDVLECNAHLVVEDPNLDLYKFEGKLSIGDEVSPLTNSEIIYRGSIIRNTAEVIGMVIYTGEECKIRMNATKNPRIKAPALQTMVNKVVVILVIFVVVLAIFNTVAYQIWKENVEEESWYLANAGVAFFPILVSFIILFNTMIPLSLYVSLEIVKLFQMFFMNDIDMYDEASNTPMEARTSTINEELGQVNYIFSDKTGTLTNNSMRFRKLSIAGTAWIHDRDLQDDTNREAARRLPNQKRRSKGKKAVWRKQGTSTPEGRSAEPASSPKTPVTPMARNGSTATRWTPSAGHHVSQPDLGTTALMEYLQRRPHTLFARKVRFFLVSMALCHTCYPETRADGAIDYQAASPDEQALVRAAQELGYIVIDRQNATITIKTSLSGSEEDNQFETYQILDVLEFSSSRKRMSIIVRMPDQRICVFCKGADSILIQLLRQYDLAIAKAVEVEQRANQRQSLEAQVAIRRQSEAKNRKSSMTRKSMSIHRPSMTARRLQPIRDEVHGWLTERENEINLSPLDNESVYYSPRPSAHYGFRQPIKSLDRRPSIQEDDKNELVEEALVVDDDAVFERCFQHVNDFATEGLRTLLYGYRYIEEAEYKDWKKIYLDASTSLVDRQEKMENAAAIVERDLDLGGATAIEDKLQDGVPDSIDKLRRASIKIWVLTGDKRETAINVGHSCRLIKDYSTLTILDQELEDVGQRIAAATLEMNNGTVAHSVIVIDGHTLSQVMPSLSLRRLFLSLAIQVDSVICCRASPAQKALLVSSIRHKVRNAITLAIGDGANDIAMIQEAHVGIGITGKEGLQAARTSDYSIAQFRFLTKLLLVHGRWNYIRTCKYTLGTFWKEMVFYLTQALYQRYAGYTGTSLYESWSLAMFNTLFTSLPVIFMGIFEQDLTAATLLAVPELYHSLGHRNGGFNIKRYLVWVAMAASQAVVVFFIMLGLYGQAMFTTDNGLYAMGDLTFTACIIIIAAKMQFWELQNKTYTCAISMFISIGGWFLWNVILSSTYTNNVIYNVIDGFFDRFGRNPLWWLTLILIVTACWAIEIGVKTVKASWLPSDADVFRELEKDPVIKRRFKEAAGTHPPANGMQDTLHSVRTASEDQEREQEVREMLSRPRHSRGTSRASHEVEIETPSTVRRRQPSESEVKSPQEHKVSFAVADRVREDDTHDDDDDEDTTGKGKPRRRSTDVQEVLKRKFGSVKRSLDVV